MRSPEIEASFTQSLEEFISANLDLLQIDSNEQTITHKLAECMTGHFGGWTVDCEYNRIGREKRRKLIHYCKTAFIKAKESGVVPDYIISLKELERSEHATSVFPDIIVHRRQDPNANLLIVEVKKANNPEVTLGWDQWKIQFFVHSLGYIAGAFVVFNTGVYGRQWEDLVRTIEWFR
jgi:hypothetical protein